jgi:hypothetical protein
MPKWFDDFLNWRNDPWAGAPSWALQLDAHLIRMENKIMAALDDLQAAVAAEDTVVDSAVALLQGLKAALDAAGTDPVKLSALSADITAKTASLSAAVAANTPAV